MSSSRYIITPLAHTSRSLISPLSLLTSLALLALLLTGCRDTTRSSDSGDACDPTAEVTTCQSYCIQVGDASEGVCTKTCDGADDISCPRDTRCESLMTAEGPRWLCVPDADCGELSFRGACEGDTLRYCGARGVEEIDCASELASDGAPMRCDVVSDAYGADCVPQSYSGECGDATLQGRCLDQAVVYCESYETGRVISEMCEVGDECRADQWGVFGCHPADLDGCDRVTARGRCDGQQVTYCEDQTLRQVSCEEGEACGLSDQVFECLSASADTRTVTGIWRYERPQEVTAVDDPILSSAQPPVEFPIRSALVQLYTEDYEVLGATLTDDEGRFELLYDAPEGASLFVAVLSASVDDQYPLEVVDCPSCTTDHNQAKLFAVASDPFQSVGASQDIGAWVVSGEPSGAFNIFDVGVRGYDYVREQIEVTLPSLLFEWAPGEVTRCETSCSSASVVWIGGGDQDPDQFDNAVIAHEFAHFAEQYISRSDSPGGFHDGGRTVPTLAWGEGYANYFSASLRSQTVYLDYTSTNGDLRWDIGHVVSAQLDHPRGERQPISEYTVSGLLWQVARDQLGAQSISRAVYEYLRPPHRDGGVQGIDLVDLLNGLKCLNFPMNDLVTEVVRGQYQFPYRLITDDECRAP